MPISVNSRDESKDPEGATKIGPARSQAKAPQDPYGHQERYQRLLNQIRKGDLSEAEKRLLLEYQEDCLTRGLSLSRVIKFLTYLLQIRGWLAQDFKPATRKDIERLVLRFEQSDYALYTKNDYKVTLKKFYQWLRQTADGYPPEVAWIKTKVPNGNYKLPEELLTKEEVDKMVHACYNLRDQALLSFLYESGCRVGELLSLQNKHVTFENGGASITIPRGKTGARRVRVIASSPYLALWLKEHPHREQKDAPLWVAIQKGYEGSQRKATHQETPEPLTYPAVNKLIREAAKRTGIKKRVNPHNFRHSRATELANSLTDAQMKQYLGWVPGSDMAAVYVHLSGRDTDQAINRLYGIETEEEAQKKPQKPPECPRCKFLNPVGNKFCGQCTAPLDVRTMLAMMEQLQGKGNEETVKAAKIDAALANLVSHPKTIALFRELLQEQANGT